MKKKWLAVILSMTMTAGLLAGCGGSSSDSGGKAESDESQETEVRDISEVTAGDDAAIADEIVIARSMDTTNLDPVLLSYTADIQIVNLICEQLVTTNDDGTEIIPSLAESWDISEDGLTYTFHIIPDLQFSDGTYVTADDWQFSFERAMTTEESSWSFSVDNIVSVETPDDDTVILTLEEPMANLLSNLSCFNVSLQSKAHYEETKGYEDAGSYPIGTGSYCVSEWVTNDHITLTANEYYHGDQPRTQSLKFVTVSDDNSKIMMLESGEVDIATDIPYANMEEINNTDGFTAEGLESTSNRYIIFNETSGDALASQQVREALLYATDKQTLVDMVLYGYGEPAVSFMPKNGLYWNDEIEAVEYDPEMASQLLEEAGCGDGLELEILVPSGNDTFSQVATILQDMWSQVGVSLTITQMDQATLYEDEMNMEHQIVIGSWSDDIADPSQLAAYWWDYSSSQCFFTGYQNEEAQQIFEESNYELDESARADMYYQLQQIWYDDVVGINLYHANATVAVSDSIQGYVQTPLYTYRFDDLIKVTE